MNVRLGGMASAIRADFARKQDRIREALHSAAPAGIEVLRAATPVKTGRLRDGWYARFERDGLYFVNEVEYLPFVEEGTVHMAPRFFVRNALPVLAREVESAVRFLR